MLTNFKFMKFNPIATVISAILIIVCIISLFTKGLNYGIDFSGGISMELDIKDKDLTMDKLRNQLSIYNPELQSVENSDLVMVRIGLSKDMTEEDQNKMLHEIKDNLGNSVEYRQIEVVGPKIGSELIRGGVLAIIFALLSMAVYIWIRYSGGFALGATLSMTFDVISLFGFFSLLQLDFSLTSVAVILLGVGYSMNDTVVNYDRIRENLYKLRKTPLTDIIDLSINEMLLRTILTNVSTLLVVGALLIWGGASLYVFSLAMMFSIISGTFSSIWISNALLLKTNVNHNNI